MTVESIRPIKDHHDPPPISILSQLYTEPSRQEPDPLISVLSRFYSGPSHRGPGH